MLATRTPADVESRSERLARLRREADAHYAQMLAEAAARGVVVR